MNRQDAIAIAQRIASEGVVADAGNVRELRSGWYVPWRSVDGQILFGSNGVIVNKKTGECFTLGSRFPIQRDLEAYENGFQAKCYDLKIVRVADRERTLEFLSKLEISVVEPEWAHGTEWRIPRSLTLKELGTAISDLPCIFPGIYTYFVIETIQHARRHKFCEFDLIEVSGGAV